MPATAQDTMYLGIVRQIHGGAVASDLAAGNLTAAGVDVQKEQGYVALITDPATQAQGQALVDADSAAIASMTPAQQDAAVSSFAQINAHLTANAATLNADPTYNATEGNLTSNQLATTANAASGATNNFLNASSLDAGVAVWVQQGGLKAVAQGAVTGDQNKAINLPNFLGSIGGKIALAIGVAALAVGALYLYAKGR